MAAEAQRLNAQRTQLLVRCQAAREQRRRLEMLEARDIHERAIQRREEADAALLEASQARVAQLRARYDDITSKTVTGADIQSLRGMEEGLSASQSQQRQNLSDAEYDVHTAAEGVDVASRAFVAEAQRTRKREKMAEQSQRLYERAQIEIEEAEAEEEMSDRLSATPSRT